jgi:hypothetical protein
MDKLPRELWQLIFAEILSIDIMLVSNEALEIVLSMPCDLVQRGVQRVIASPAAALLITKLPSTLYEKMSLTQRAEVPNLLIPRIDKTAFSSQIFISGFKYTRIPWPDIVKHRHAEPFHQRAYQYFRWTFTQYEQYRYHILTTHAIRRERDSTVYDWINGKLIDAVVPFMTERIWNYYVMNDPDAVLNITAEWMSLRANGRGQ